MKKVILSTVIAICLLLCILLCLKLFTKNDNKKINNGNNKSIKEIEQYLLNINSYKANIEATIKSNKNENKYMMEQEVKENFAKQTVIKPEDIAGMEMIYENGNLQIRNTNLNVSKVYNSYPYVSNNILFLTSFFNTYQSVEDKLIEEIDGAIYMKCTNKDSQYNNKQILKIDKDNLKPQALEIQDINNQSKVYILYNEIEFNI